MNRPDTDGENELRRKGRLAMKRKRGKLTLAVFIDAFGWEVLKRKPDFLSDLLPHRRRLRSVFGYSCTAIPTILSGELPRVHGHFSFFFRSDDSPFRPLRPLGLLPSALVERGRVRNWISRLVARAYGYTGYFQLYMMPFRHLHLFDYCEKEDLYVPGAMKPCRTLFDELHSASVRYHVSDWRRSEEHNVREALEKVRSGSYEFVYLYTAALDSLLHATGKDAPQVTRKLEWYERRLRELFEAAESAHDKVELFVFSDHGMSDVHSTFDLMARVDECGFEFGRHYTAVYDSTMARFWFDDERARETISSMLEGLDCGRILTRDELERWGCWFDDGKYGELFFLMNDGVLIVPSFMGNVKLAGMHGYDPSTPDAWATMLSNVPLPDFVEGLTDIKRLLLASAGVSRAAAAQAA